MNLEWRHENTKWITGYAGGRFRVGIFRQKNGYAVAGDSGNAFASLDDAKTHAALWLEFWSAAHQHKEPDAEWRKKMGRKPEARTP